MKFGYCINMLSLPGSDASGREMLPMIARLGFDYAEMPMAQMMAYDDADFERLFLNPLRKSELECHCCNNFFPASMHLTGPEADHDAACRYAEKAMARARQLGAAKIVFGSAGARNYPAGFPRAEAQQQLANLLRQLEPIAAANGITLVMEHLNRLESNLLTSLREGAALVQALALPHVRCLMDNYHMMLGGGSLDEAREAGQWLRHVHLARILGRSLPCEGDEVSWPSVFSVLREVGYSGDCSIEAYVPVEGREALIGQALRFLKQTAASL